MEHDHPENASTEQTQPMLCDKDYAPTEDDGESCSGGDSCGNTNITHISDTDSEVNNQHYLSCTKFMFPVHNQTLFINKNHLNMLLIHSPNICKCKKEI